MNIFFRVDARQQAGAGHLMRCAALAEVLRNRGCRVNFIVERGSEVLLGLLMAKNLPFCEVQEVDNWKQDAANTINLIKDWNSDWAVLDHYCLGIEWQRAVRAHARRGLFLIDDMASTSHCCDMVLNQNFFGDQRDIYDSLVPKRCVQLVGPRYALLRGEFAENRKPVKCVPRKPKRVFVCFGGVDDCGVTAAVTESLVRYSKAPLEIDVVLGMSGPQAHRIKELNHVRGNIRLHIGVDRMASLMVKADFAIGAGGISTWERMCVGLPSAAFSLAPNQAVGIRRLDKAGLIKSLGYYDNSERRNIDNVLHPLLSNFEWAGASQRRGQALVDGQGTERVANLLVAES